MEGVRRASSRRRLWLGICLAALTAAAAATAAPGPIIAVGDVHGDLGAFRGILAEAGVIDAGGVWSGGDTTLVQLGDLIDRGPGMRGTLDFAMGLERTAPAGQAVFLLGNHEVMNMTGDLRYVAAANYAEFADSESEKRREEAWRKVRDLRRTRARRLGQPEPPSGPDEQKAWLDAHPPGSIEHAEAFGPAGKYGRWLRTHSAIFAARGVAFLHGGLSPAYSRDPLAAIDRRVHEDLAAFDADRKLFVEEGLILDFFDLHETFAALREELQSGGPIDAERKKIYERFLDWGSWTINAADGPLWFRGYSEWSDAEGDARVPGLLSAAGVERFVVGHTVQPDGRIRVRFAGAVFLIDTGMLSSHFRGGRASALVLADGTASAIYPGEARQVIWRAPAKAAARAAAWLTPLAATGAAP